MIVGKRTHCQPVRRLIRIDFDFENVLRCEVVKVLQRTASGYGNFGCFPTKQHVLNQLQSVSKVK
jgi:hypothetical protein